MQRLSPWKTLPPCPHAGTMSQTSLLVVDDQGMVRDWLHGILTAHGYQVIAVASGEAALAVVERGVHVSLALLAIRMPEAQIDGITAARALLHHRIRCVLLASSTDIQSRVAASMVGVLGYLVKDTATAATILATVQAALRNDPLPDVLGDVPPEQAHRARRRQERLQQQWASLTPAQRRVAALAAQGKTNVDIAHALGVAPSTIQSHMQEILARLCLTSRRSLQDDTIYLAGISGYRPERSME